MATPEKLLAVYRKIRDKRKTPTAQPREMFGDPLNLLHQETARQFLAARYAQRQQAAAHGKPGNDQGAHAQNFTTGLLSFAHEVNGQLALSMGVEPRSPFSDRRVIEFAIRMPLVAKLCAPWYKHLLRQCMVGILPEAVRWRSDIGEHPGWKFYERLLLEMEQNVPNVWNPQHFNEVLGRWIDEFKVKSGCKRVLSEQGFVCWGQSFSARCPDGVVGCPGARPCADRMTFQTLSSNRVYVMNPQSRIQNPVPGPRKKYTAPSLVVYGAVGDLTQSGTTEGSTNVTVRRVHQQSRRCGSERRVKENIVRIGDHPLGFGLYLFDYRPEFRAQWGHGRQFGVMIDEVETVMPEAVFGQPDGYKLVDYSRLGIRQHRH